MPEKRYQAYNRHTGAEIIAACDWIPGNAIIQPGSWHVAEDGEPQFEWGDETKMCWDGCETETRDGHTVYWDAMNGECDERDIVLLEVDDEGDPVHMTENGEPDLTKGLAFTPRTIRRFNDAGGSEASHDLLNAAWAVIHNWSSGDLAGAVNNLEGAAEELAKALGLERPEPAELAEGE